VFLLIEVAVALGCLVQKPVESAYGAFVLLVGAGAWRLWRRAPGAAGGSPR
jgi:hypothetical protein